MDFSCEPLLGKHPSYLFDSTKYASKTVGRGNFEIKMKIIMV